MSSGSYDWSIKNFWPYFSLSFILVIIQYWMMPTSTGCALFEVLGLGIFLYIIDWFFCRNNHINTIKNVESWKPDFFLNSLTCTCDTCEKWRKKRWWKTAITILAPGLIFLFISLYAIASAYSNTPKGKYPKRTITEVEVMGKYKALEIKLRTSITTDYHDYFDIYKVPENEIIEGQKGNYYIVDLKIPTTKDTVLFKSGQYTMGSFDKSLLVPLNKFVTEVYSYLDAGTDCKLYIKGSADLLGNATFSDKLEGEYNGNEFHRIPYLPSLGNDKFSRKQQVHSIGSIYNNADLPFLRSAFIKEKIIQNYEGMPKPLLLEGSVEKEVGESFRNALLILYVDFTKKKFKD